MRYVRFRTGEHSPEMTGIIYGEHIRRIEGDILSGYTQTTEEYELSGVKLLAPIVPGKVVGVAANYRSFLDAKGQEYPERPRIFLKPSSSVIGTGDDIICPDTAHEVAFEGEIAVVIGKRCSHATADTAMDYIFGYTCINDVTDRTMVAEDGIWERGKGSDTFAPIGPCITTVDELDGMDALIETRLNGKVVQHMKSSDMFFDIHKLIEYISRTMTLEPGDIIATGTPVGAGVMNIGDEIEIEIEKIGVLKNRFAERK